MPARLFLIAILLALTSIALPGTAPTSMPAGDKSGTALVVGRDFSRCGYDGGPSPLQLLPMWSFHPEDTMFFGVVSIPRLASRSGNSTR